MRIGELSDVGDSGVGRPGDEKAHDNDEHHLERLQLLPGHLEGG